MAYHDVTCYLKKYSLLLNACEKTTKNAIKAPTHYALGAIKEINVLDYIELLKIKEAKLEKNLIKTKAGIKSNFRM